VSGRIAAACALVLVCVVAGCGGDKGGGTAFPASAPQGLLVAVDAPFSRSPYIGETIANGVELAVGEVNAQGIVAGSKSYKLKVKRYDNALSPRKSLANVRHAIADGAVAIVTDGTGVDATWETARRAGVPVGVTYDGGMGLVDVKARPNVFRIAPTDRGIAFRLAEYTIPKGLRLGLLSDDTTYGREGAQALDKAFASNPEAVSLRATLPYGGTDVTPQVLRARREGATGLVVWGQASTIAAVVVAARSAGWNVPIFAPPTAEDPALRQLLADRPRWLDGLTFATGRMTAEVGTAPFDAFRAKYESVYGVEKVGVRTRDGAEVVGLPDYAMYSYDYVKVLAQALMRAAAAGSDLSRALEQVQAPGANGDTRSFNQVSHEGVVDDDIFFARFDDMTFQPVKDDPLSSTLPSIQQTGGR